MPPSPSLTLTRSAIEQAKRQKLKKVVVLDVMKNRRDMVRLPNGHVQFTGSVRYPDIYITARFLPDNHQWVVTDIEIVSEASTPEPESTSDAVIKSDQHDTSPAAIVFTKHAENVLRSEFLDHRVIEQIIRRPDKKRNEDDAKVRFIGKAHGDKLHVIAKFLPDENKWLVITVELRYKQESEPLIDTSQFDGEPTDKHPGVTFTTHALERMTLRNIYPSEVKETVLHPEKTFENEEDTVKFIGKELSLNRAIHVVGKFLPDDNKWLVISVWVRGEEDDGSLSKWTPQRAQPSGGHPRIAFTKHVREWMNSHQVEKTDLETILRDPDKKLDQNDGKVKFTGKIVRQGQAVHVIAKFLPEENKWLVITAWMLHSRNRQTHSKTGMGTYLELVRFIIFILVAVSIAYLFIRLFLESGGF